VVFYYGAKLVQPLELAEDKSVQLLTETNVKPSLDDL